MPWLTNAAPAMRLTGLCGEVRGALWQGACHASILTAYPVQQRAHVWIVIGDVMASWRTEDGLETRIRYPDA